MPRTSANQPPASLPATAPIQGAQPRMPSKFFPPPRSWHASGIVQLGGALTVERLLDAYRHGIFPWPSSRHDPMVWASPDPRGVVPLDRFHISTRLRRRLASGQYQSSCNQAFEPVIDACRVGPAREEGTWITPELRAAYVRLHRLGVAHSVETWRDGRLVGGVYGVATGGAFAAESMFYRERDGSKIALARLVAHLTCRGYRLLDIQQWTPHTGSLGAIEISRREFLHRLAEIRDLPLTFGDRLEGAD